jgi:hypothetical protein
MMAFDRTPGSQSLDAATVSALRAALTRSLETGSHGDDLKAVLATCAAEAKRKGVLAEQLLLALKDVWYSLPQVSSHPANEVQTRLLQQLIARCIQDYYAN